MQGIPEGFLDLIIDKGRAFGVLATIVKGGDPIVTPIWFLNEGDYLLFSSSENNLKTRNIALHPQVALAIMTENNHLRYLEVRGKVVGRVEDPNLTLRRRLWLKYVGREPEPVSEPTANPDFFFQIQPEKVRTLDYTQFINPTKH